MSSSPRFRRSLALLGATMLMVGIAAAPASGAGPLAEVPFVVSDTGLFGAPSAGGGMGHKGSWAFERGRMTGGNLELHLEVDPPAQTLPVRSGPAVLFAELLLYGTPGGDIGMERALPPIGATEIPACADDAACHYSVDISVPTAGLKDAIASLERGGMLVAVSVQLTLVRTFGAGQWLQVAELLNGPGGNSGSQAGTLGAMTPAHGELFWAGLFPADQALVVPKGAFGQPKPLDYAALVERLRAQAADASTPLAMVDVAIHVRFEPACPYDQELILHDLDRNHLFHAYTDNKHPAIDAVTHMPVGTPWLLTLHGGDGVDFAGQPHLGPIQSDGSPVEIHATIDCLGNTGSLELVGASVPTAPPSPTAEASATGESTSLRSAQPTAPASSSPEQTAAPVSSMADGPSGMLLATGLALVLGIGVVGHAVRRRAGGTSRP
jgi:hypothetical protein